MRPNSVDVDKSPIPLPDFIASALLVECVVVKRKLGELNCKILAPPRARTD